MRLTLRTLLSWKDRMLDPEAARDLAARVEASVDARALAARIDEVVFRPTLSAPAPDAAGFAAAANTTAEYLDNVLPPEQLAEFERVCFTSEAQLAETAAAHEILAELSRTPPAPLAPAASRRLLATVRARAEGAGPAGPRTLASAPVTPRSRETPRASSAPARSTRQATSAWLLVAAAILLLATLVGVLGWSLTKAGRARGRAREVAARKAAAAARVVPAREASSPPAPPPLPAPPIESIDSAPAPPAPMAAARMPEPGAPQPPAATTESTPAPVAVALEPPAPPPAAPPATEPSPPPAPPAPVAASAPRVPQGDALAIAAPAATPPQAASEAAAVPPAAIAPAVTVAGPDVVLFRRGNDRTAEWLVGAEPLPLALPADLVAPPFCRPALVVNDLRIELEPGTRAVLGCDTAGAPQLEVVFGAAVIAGVGRLGLVAGDLSGAIETDAAAPVGVEVVLRRPPGAGADATQRSARIIPTAGRVGWQPGTAAGSRDVPVGQAVEWRGGVSSAPELRDAGPLPAWLNGGRTATAFERRAADALAAGLSAGSPAVPALRELAADRRVENRVAAAAALALVGEFDELARLLVADGAAAVPESLWGRLDEVAVQPALARGARAADAFAAAVTARAPVGAADAVNRFAGGTSDEQLAAGAAAELVAALESPHLAVRRYAIKNLVEIVEPAEIDGLRYRADRPPEALRAGAEWWRMQLERGHLRRAATETSAER